MRNTESGQTSKKLALSEEMPVFCELTPINTEINFVLQSLLTNLPVPIFSSHHEKNLKNYIIMALKRIL